jgi:hypothetical protein
MAFRESTWVALTQAHDGSLSAVTPSPRIIDLSHLELVVPLHISGRTAGRVRRAPSSTSVEGQLRLRGFVWDRVPHPKVLSFNLGTRLTGLP